MSLEKIFKEIKETYLALRLKEFKHRLTHDKNAKLMAKGLERFEKCKSKKPKSQIKKEINLCKKYWHCYPLHYYRYDLYRKDKQLSVKEIISYIPEFFFYVLFLPFYDSGKYEILLTDKAITEQFFRSLNISQPHTICKLFKSRFFTSQLAEKLFISMEQELAEKKYKKLFVKPINGHGGYGIYVFNKNDKGQYVSNHNEVFNENFLKKIGDTNDYIIQSGLEQDPEISKIYPHSVNTLRIATENLDEKIRILCATLRMGRCGMQVDNGSQDGMLTKVNTKNGFLGDYATTEQGGYFEKHPDTDFVFKGSKIPNWDKVKEFVVRSAEKTSQFTYLGWDIALSKDGPVAIETNLGFGIDHYQVALGGMREIFKISDPGFYWKNKGKRI